LGHANPFNTEQNVIGNVNTLARNMGTLNNNFTVYSNQTTKAVVQVKNNAGPFPAPGTVVISGGTRFTVLGTRFNVGGTPGPNIQSGLGTYLNAVNTAAPFVSYGQNSDPSAGFLAKVLNDNDAIELGILWAKRNPLTGLLVPSGGGHFVTLQAITMTSATKGTAELIDPWGATGPGGTPGSTANDVMVQVGTQGGELTIAGTFGNDADTIGPFFGGPGSAMSGLVAIDEIETLPATPLPVATPDSSTYLNEAWLLTLVGMVAVRKWRAVRPMA
jgi:hypothetical protein